ncbi:MAG: hypothetical protein ACI8RZ_004368 [Myxococcota bacterium]|jgi:hypothetical protein
MSRLWPVLLWIVAALWLGWWLTGNPLPDGYQNEYLHIGNALDLWAALAERDVWHLRWYMYTGYWPWGFYAVPWPMMALLGPGRMALIATNLIHLGVLLAAMGSLGRRLGAPLAPVLLLLCPGVFGSLVRYEPNLAVIAWTAAGLAFLIRSQGLRVRGDVLGYGLCLGVGLMMDRLTVLFFLAPAVLPLLRGADRRAWGNLALGLGATLLLSAAYYREFFIRHTAELLSQAPVGEIDSAGAVTVGDGLLDAVYYPLVLLDSQAGPIIGGLMLWGVGAAVMELWRERGRSRAAGVLLAAIIPATIFFTFIAKKQVYYTLPALAPLAVLAAGRGRLAWLGVLGGVWSWLAVGIGAVPGGPWMPIDWVAPRHILARPPSGQDWPLDEASAVLLGGSGGVLVFSEDSTLFEGFVTLAVREALPGRTVRGVTLDPIGSYEFLSELDGFVWVGSPGGAWPAASRIRSELLTDHYDLAELPDLGGAIEAAGSGFVEQGRWPAGDMELVVFSRTD